VSLSDDEPRHPQTHVLGQDLSALSLADIDERVEQLQAEVERLQAERRRKQAAQAAADNFFRS
jgi:uncharacterized small protein (DUF1192 family)